MDIRRICLGIISALFVLTGIAAYVLGWEGVMFWVMLRSGLALGAVWLAMPQLTSDDSKLTVPVLLLGVLLVMIMATKPRLLLLFGALAIAAFLLQGVARRFTKGMKK